MTTPPPTDDGLQRYLRRRRLARECALQYLYQNDVQDDWDCTPERLQRFWDQARALADGAPEEEFERAREFAERLICGVAAEREKLDAMIRESAQNWTLERMGVVDRNIIRLAAFELYGCDDVPDVAAINEAIELAKEFGHEDSARFVNGIVDRLYRQRQGEA